MLDYLVGAKTCREQKQNDRRLLVYRRYIDNDDEDDEEFMHDLKSDV